MSRRDLWRLLFVMAVLPARTASGQGPVPDVRWALSSGTLSFLGHATVGDFIGSTSRVFGAVTGDLRAARGWIEAPVGTLDTKNDRRNRDLRASMEAETYPTMRFDLDSVVVVSSSAEVRDTLELLFRGRLAIHGVTRALEVPATASYHGDTLHVASVFPLDVTDYHIGGLTKLFGLLRMKRQIEVSVDLRFVVADGLTRVQRPSPTAPPRMAARSARH